MNIGQGNFPILSFEQANPYLTGAQVGQGMVTQGLQQQDLQQKIQQALMANQLQKALLPTQQQLGIAQNNAALQLLPYQTKAGIASNEATAQYALPEEKEKYKGMLIGNQYKPLLDLATVQNSISKQQQLQQSQSRFGGAFNTVRMVQAMDPGYRAQWLSDPNNSKAYDTATAIVGNQFLQQSANPVQQNASSPLQQMLNEKLKSMGYATPSPAVQYNNSNISPVQFKAPTPEQTQAETDIAGSSAIHKTQTTAQQNQRLFGATAEQLYQEANPLIPSVKKFTGLKGSAKLAKNMYNAATGNETDQEYNDYVKFRNQLVPAYANELKRTLGGQATDQESRIFNEATSPNLLFSTPHQIQQLWDQLHEIGKRQEKVLRQSPAQINKGELPSKKKLKYNLQTGTFE